MVDRIIMLLITFDILLVVLNVKCCYSNNAFIKSSGLKAFKSVICSPTPTSLTGSFISFAIAIIIAPFALPSSLVRATQVKFTDSEKTFACCNPFCPVLASITRILSRKEFGA